MCKVRCWRWLFGNKIPISGQVNDIYMGNALWLAWATTTTAGCPLLCVCVRERERERGRCEREKEREGETRGGGERE